ncbi:MAG: DUF1015 family protein [Candidatus Dormibacteria bacterium]
MATVHPLRGIRYDPEHVSLGGVLAPPYDVISDAEREELYARDLRNIVRIDYCRPEPADSAEGAERYLRAAHHLESWLRLGILVADRSPTVYVSDHEFQGTTGTLSRRRGIFVTVPARRWEDGEVRPHERTLRGPKQDRLALMRATGTQTSAVWALWDQAPGLEAILDRATAGRALLGGRTAGEQGPEKHLLWAVSDPQVVAAVTDCLAAARLYIADGHHRYETAVAYAEEQAAAASSGSDPQVLLYLSGANDPDLEILPTHRLVAAGYGVPRSLDELRARLPSAARLEPAHNLATAAQIASNDHGDHRYAVRASDGAAVLVLPRDRQPSPRGGLDVVALEEVVLGGACAITPERITEGALRYTRSLHEIERAVQSGDAALGFGLRGCTTAELIAVSDAGETMPQKSTYFYPKVPTGLVLLTL